MTKKIILCSDGTWNRFGQKDRGQVVRNNVQRLYQGLLNDGGTRQVVFYDEGVGTGGLFDRWIGGLTGAGLQTNVVQAYRNIVQEFNPGDDVFCTGFSRGAFTARSVAGFIYKCGILRRLDPGRLREAYRLYKRKDIKPSSEYMANYRREHAHPESRRVHFVGVWDTVGALGIPLNLFNALNRKRHSFHDTRLNRQVRHGYHALAIDECRRPFAPTLWDFVDMPEDARLDQRWFAGVHSNVGGGYLDDGLSQIALHWLANAIRDAGGLFHEQFFEGLPAMAAHRGELRDSFGFPYWLLGRYPRPISSVATLDPTVEARWTDPQVDPPYRPANLLQLPFHAESKKPKT